MQPQLPRRRVVAVIGGADEAEAACAVAEAVGRCLVDAGYRVATGGLSGVMAAASRGARASSAWREGDVIGVLPGLSPDDANPWVDIVIPTGLHYARNALLIAMVDAVVVVGGAAGTLSEVALAWQYEKVVVAVLGVGGWGERLAGTALDHRREDRVHGAETAEAAIGLLAKHLH